MRNIFMFSATHNSTINKFLYTSQLIYNSNNLLKNPQIKRLLNSIKIIILNFKDPRKICEFNN